jgi:catechol 2,3-dioxygenase-like lactoylglutathione lyase family enzyme
MDWRLEVVVLPVSDVDRSKEFYAVKLGFPVDHDTVRGAMRIVQVTPPGSGCSIVFGDGISPGEPGTYKGLQLVVADIEAAHQHLVTGGIESSPVRHMGENGWEEGPGGDWNSFVFFDDPDGNSWTVQQSPNSD